MRVMQLIDSLHAGGAERMAVNLANALVSRIDQSFLCSTREEGILTKSIKNKVNYLFLNKRFSLDLFAINRLNRYIKNNEISIIHAHSSSFFMASIIKILNKEVKLVWHDHYGNSEFLDNRRSLVLKLSSRFFDQVFSVNRSLESWAKKNLLVKKIIYMPNFVVPSNVKPQTKLHGEDGKRIVCLANLRPQKDHSTLLKSFSEVSKIFGDWTLHIVGKDFNDSYSQKIKDEIKGLNLTNSVYMYGSKPDIGNILSQCEIGVLSSRSEGLPLALLEYGLSSLSVIATNVGLCHEVITDGTNGLLIDSGEQDSLKRALVLLIENQDQRKKMAKQFNVNILDNFSEKATTEKVIEIYNMLKCDK